MDVGFYGFLISLGALFLCAQMAHHLRCIRRDGLKIIEPPDEDKGRSVPAKPAPEPPQVKQVKIHETLSPDKWPIQATPRTTVYDEELRDLTEYVMHGGHITGLMLDRIIRKDT